MLNIFIFIVIIPSVFFTPLIVDKFVLRAFFILLFSDLNSFEFINDTFAPESYTPKISTVSCSSNLILINGGIISFLYLFQLIQTLSLCCLQLLFGFFFPVLFMCVKPTCRFGVVTVHLTFLFTDFAWVFLLFLFLIFFSVSVGAFLLYQVFQAS